MKRSRRRTAVSWSGGKDSALALHKGRLGGMSIDYLLNTVRKDSGRVAFHGVRAGLIKRQADAMDLPLLQRTVGDDDYRAVFLGALDELKGKGVGTVVFGDIDVEQNRAWCESVCREAGMDPQFPLWMRAQKDLMKEFVDAGFRAITVCIESAFFEERDLGAELDTAWLDRIEQLRAASPSLTYCGENGEYHSFVYGGPIFRNKVPFIKGRSVSMSAHRLLDLE